MKKSASKQLRGKKRLKKSAERAMDGSVALVKENLSILGFLLSGKPTVLRHASINKRYVPPQSAINKSIGLGSTKVLGEVLRNLKSLVGSSLTHLLIKK